MHVTLKCPRCGAGLTATKMLADNTPIQCPNCQHTLRFRVNPPSPAPPPKSGEVPVTPRLTPVNSGTPPKGPVVKAELAGEPPAQATPATVTLSVRALILGAAGVLLLLVGLGAGIAVYLLNRDETPSDSKATDQTLTETEEQSNSSEKKTSPQNSSQKLTGQGAEVKSSGQLKSSGSGPGEPVPGPETGNWLAVTPPPEQSADQVFRAVVSQTALQATFSPDSNYLATVEQDGKSYLWDLEQRRRADLLVREGIDWNDMILQFSPDSRYLAVCESEGPAALWSVQDARPLLEWTVGPIYPRGLFFSFDSTRLFECGEHSLSMTELAVTPPQRNTLADKLNDITLFCGAISPDGKVLVLGGHGQETGEFRFWNLQQNKQVPGRTGFAGSVWEIGFSADSGHMAVLSTQGSSPPARHQWSDYHRPQDLTMWKLTPDRTSADIVDRRQALHLQYVPQTGSVRVQAIQQNGEQYQFQETEPGNQIPRNSGTINTQSFAFALGSPSAQRLALNYRTSSAGPAYNSAVSVFNAATGLLERPILETAGVALSSQGRYLLTTNGTIVDLDSQATQQLALLKTLQHPHTITAVGANGQQLVVAVEGSYQTQELPHGGVKLWSAEAFQQIALIPFQGRSDAYGLSADGRILLAAGRVAQNYQLILFELTSQGVQQRHVIPRDMLLDKELNRNAVQRISLSNDGKTAAVYWGGSPDSFDVYDLTNAPKRVQMGKIQGGFYTRCATLSPDGQYYALGSSGGAVAIYDNNTGAFLPSLAQHNDAIGAIAFSPDSRQFVLAGSQGQLDLWETRSGARQLRYKGFLGELSAVSFSPDGKYIAAAGSSSQGAMGMVWETQSGNMLGSLSGHDSQVTVLRFLPVSKGQRLASGDKNGHLLVWDLPVPSN